MILILPYQPTWPADFQALAAPLRGALGGLAARIDHIGSTAVPGLPAKDIIDIQVSVTALSPAVEKALLSLGYSRRAGIAMDHIPPAGPADPALWGKWYFTPPADLRPMHLHVRLLGCPNQRYPLLFRDFLRTHPATADAYAQIKRALAHFHADDLDAYYAVKDPVCDLIIDAAEIWAGVTAWQPGPPDA